MYSQIRSFTAGVLARALIAFSISPMIPNLGVGKCPDRIIVAVVTDSFGPISGDEDPIAVWSSAVEKDNLEISWCKIRNSLPFEFI